MPTLPKYCSNKFLFWVRHSSKPVNTFSPCLICATIQKMDFIDNHKRRGGRFPSMNGIFLYEIQNNCWKKRRGEHNYPGMCGVRLYWFFLKTFITESIKISFLIFRTDAHSLKTVFYGQNGQLAIVIKEYS